MKNNGAKPARRLRSQAWFDDPTNPDVTSGYLERYLNFGFTREELQSGKPIIGIAQTGSDLSPCNRHHLELAHRVREGIRSAGGICRSMRLEITGIEAIALAPVLASMSSAFFTD